MTQSPIDAYRTVGATTADPITLTTMLYDGALKALRRAQLFAEQNDRERLARETERAHLIVGELLSTLDLSQGELPNQMAALYVYCIRCIVEGGMGNVDRLMEAERHLATVAGAWKTATASLTSSVDLQGRAAALA